MAKKREALAVPITERLVVSAQQFAALTGVGDDTVLKWLHDPKFPAFRDGKGVGGSYRIVVSEAHAWLAKRAINRDNMPSGIGAFDVLKQHRNKKEVRCE